MFRLLVLAAFVSAASLVRGGPLNDLAIFGYDPVADKKAVVVSGNARFTVLSHYVIRMEYQPNATFEDRATLAMVNRKRPVPAFTSNTNEAGLLTITTSKITLKYQTGNAFSSSTLTVKAANGKQYKYGDIDNGNLFGTIKSLDELCTISLNCTKNAGTIIHHEQLHCDWGVVSTNGWTTIDDTGNYIMSNATDGWFSNADKSVDQVDLYFFGHGTDFKAAIYDFTRISGAQQMSSRPLLGSWFTRWYDYDNDDLARLLDLYKQHSLPLDVLVLDMNWHTKNDWTGYSWDKQLFPVPNDTVAMIHSHGLMTACNLHDADGIGSFEDEYGAMCKAMGQNPAGKQPVRFAPLNRTYMHALEDIVLPATGFDFWWIDWQQGGQAGGCNGGRMNPTFVTDHVRGTDHIRRKDDIRDNILARWGGLGSQRYPVGFSGDVQSLSWECMAFQPYFSVTAANVGYGHISNDLVGPPHDHELHVRWMQFGAFSGVMRIHDRGMSAGSCWSTDDCAIVNLWRLPTKYFEAIREAMNLRVGLLPYMYTMNRNAFDTGLTMVHPLYYEWPTHQSAYAMGPGGANAQYMFGDDIMVAPITAAADSATALVTRSVWIPPGKWYDEVMGRLVTGSTDLSQSYTLYDVPRWVKAGAIIPRIPNPSQMGVANQNFLAVDYCIYPGESNASRRMYEDDGRSHGYLKGKHAWTTVSYTRTATEITVTVGAATGSYTGMPATRGTRVLIVHALPISSAMCGLTAVPYKRFGGANSWTYDGVTTTAIVDCGAVATSAGVTVTVSFAFADTTPSMINTFKAYANRAQLGKRSVDDTRETPYSVNVGPGMTKQAAAHAGLLTYLAGHSSAAFKSAADSYTTLMLDAYAELTGAPAPPPPSPKSTELLQLWSQTRQDMVLCGSEGCVYDNEDYQVMWVEGYQPAATSSETRPFYDYWSSQNTDNWGDVFSTAPNGYSMAIFQNGNVYNTKVSGSRCLELWFNSATNDHMTFGSRSGYDWAKQHGYTRQTKCVAYVTETAPPESSEFVTSAVFPGLAAFRKAQKEGRTFLARDLLSKESLAKFDRDREQRKRSVFAAGRKGLPIDEGKVEKQGSAAMTMAAAIFDSVLPAS